VLILTNNIIFCVSSLYSNMNEDTEISADKDNLEHKNDVIVESSNSPVRAEFNVSDVCIEMSLLHLCLC
jgi:hypothetical protein